MSCSVSTRSWSPTDDPAGQDRPVEHATRLPGPGGAPGPRAVGGRAGQLDLDADGHGAPPYRVAPDSTVHGARGGPGTVCAMPIYALGDQVPDIDADGLRPSRRRGHRLGARSARRARCGRTPCCAATTARSASAPARASRTARVLHTHARAPDGRRRRVRDRPHRPPRGLHHRGPGDGRQRRDRAAPLASSAPAPSSPPTPSSSTTSTSRPARSPSAPRRRSSPTGPASTRSSTASRPTSPAADRFRRDAAPARLMLALVVTVPAGEAELASDALWALGVAADRGAADRRRRAGDRGPLRRAVDVARQRRRRRHHGRRGVPGALAVAHRRGRPGRRRELAGARRAVVGRRRPRRRPGVARTSTAGDGVLRVDIDPGAAFGLGDHPTTVLTLRLLRRTLVAGRDRARRRVRQRRAVGRRGAARRALRRGDRHLAGRGRGDGRQRRAQRRRRGRSPSAPGRWRRSTSRSTSCWPTCWRRSLVELAADLRRVVAPSGALVVSGVLDGAHDHVVAALAPMQVVDTLTARAGRRCSPVTDGRGGGATSDGPGAHADRGDQAVAGGVALVLALATPEPVLVVQAGELLARRPARSTSRTPGGPWPPAAPAPAAARPTTGRRGG